MKINQMPEVIKPLIVPLLLAACHTTQPRHWLNDVTTAVHVPVDYFTPTKPLFRPGNSPQSVDKWLPPGPDMLVPVAQLSHFSGALIQSRCLKPSFFCYPIHPVSEHFGGVLARHGAGKTQSALAQDALVRGGPPRKAFIRTATPGLCGFSRGIISNAA